MRRRRRGGIGPWLYIFILLMLAGGMAEEVGLSAVLIAAGVLLGLGVGIGLLIAKAKQKKSRDEIDAKTAEIKAKAEAQVKEKEKEASPYSPEVQAIIREGRVAMKEMGRLYSSIQEPNIRSKINELMSISDKIVRDAIDDPRDVPQIRKFLDYYLPTTIKLLNAYDRMSSQEVSGENISGSMDRIENMLDTTIEAYKKQLDALFANQAADIQMDIEVMNGMLAREGLGGKSYLDLNDFLKKYETQQQYAEQQKKEQARPQTQPQTQPPAQQQILQKGSTSNG